MYKFLLDSRAVLHEINTVTHFYVAKVLDGHGESCKQNAQKIWPSFVLICRLAYIGYPNRPRTNQCPVYTS